jgi:hypothetical protein
MVLQQLQDLLAGIYDLPMQHCVYDFLFTERERLPQTLRESTPTSSCWYSMRAARLRWGCFSIRSCSSAWRWPIRSRH